MTGADFIDDFQSVDESLQSVDESRMNGPLVDALRRLPRFEPPARMEAEFLAMLAEMPTGPAAALIAAGFEPPTRLRTAMLDEFARQQDAQSPRREAVLREIARGVEPTAMLDAPLSPAADRWLRDRATRIESKTSSSDTSPIDRPRRTWPFGAWQLAAGGLMALLALGVGLRVILDTSTSASLQPVETYARSLAPAPDPTPAAPGPLAAAPAGTRSAVDADSPTLAASESVRRSARMLANGDSELEAASERAARASDKSADKGARERPAGPVGKQWKLSDDPIARLSALPAGSKWILLYSPADAKQAADWLQRGLRGTQLDPMQDRRPVQAHEPAHAREPAHPSERTRGRTSLRLEARETIPAGSLQVVLAD